MIDNSSSLISSWWSNFLMMIGTSIFKLLPLLNFKMERLPRIELGTSAWKAVVLPLNYGRKIWSRMQDLNLRYACSQSKCHTRLGESEIGAPGEIWTPGLPLTRRLLYHWVTRAYFLYILWSIGWDLNSRINGFADRAIRPLWYRCIAISDSTIICLRALLQPPLRVLRLTTSLAPTAWTLRKGRSHHDSLAAG